MTGFDFNLRNLFTGTLMGLPSTGISSPSQQASGTLQGGNPFVGGYVPSWYGGQSNPNAQPNTPPNNSAPLNPILQSPFTGSLPYDFLGLTLGNTLPTNPNLSSPFNPAAREGSSTGLPELDSLILSSNNPALVTTPFIGRSQESPNQLDVLRDSEDKIDNLLERTLRGVNELPDYGSDTEAMKKFIEDALRRANG